jgi:hypothetical protein
MGYSVVTTVLAPAASTALTDLPSAKAELVLSSVDTSNDAWLTKAIGQVTSAISRYCKRPFAPELLQDAFDIQQDPFPYQTPGGFPELQLTRWPVLDLVSVVQTMTPGPNGWTHTLCAGIDFRLDAKNGALLRLNKWTGTVTAWEALPVTVIYAAGYGALMQETDAVPTGGDTITVAGAATFSCPIAVAYADGTALVSVTSSPGQGQYSVAAGVYTFASADAEQAVTITYTTYAPPEDLEGYALRLITARFRARGRDPMMVQREDNTGTQRWWFGNAPGQTGEFPPDIQAALDSEYRVPTVV